MSCDRCVCSGIRSCLRCESSDSRHGQRLTDNELNRNKTIVNDNCLKFVYCVDCCDKAFIEGLADHAIHCSLQSMVEFKHFVRIDGVFVKSDVISAEEEEDIVHRIDSIQWIGSQSGRRKQDFGPKVNFKKRKLNSSQFSGLPQFDRQLLAKIADRLTDESVLKDFIAVEVCHLEYNPINGSAIDPHFDDFWLWGQRLVTVNLLAPTVLTLTLPVPPQQSDQKRTDTENNYRICIDLTQRSLVVLKGDSRYKYEHSIRREDIQSRRIAVTYRELSPQFLPNGSDYESTGKEIIERSMNELIL